MTYSAWYSKYISLYKQKISEKTREGYSRLNSLISPIIGDKELSEIEPDDIQRVAVTVELQTGSRQAQLAYTLMHAVFRRAVRSKHIRENPVDAIDKPEHVAKAGRAIEGTDWEALQPAICENLALALMCFAGLRRGEVLALRRADVDLAAGVIHVSRQSVRVNGRRICSPPKSSAGIRDVPISPELSQILLSAVKYLLPNALLVPISPETLARRWKQVQEKAGITKKYRLHDLRHTYATKLVLAGVNTRVLQYIIGHADYNLTLATYTHITPFSAKNELSRIYATLH